MKWGADFAFNWLYMAYGLGGVLIAGLVVIGYFFPQFRKQVIVGILGVLGAVAMYRKGNKDGEARKQKQWDSAEDNARKNVRNAVSGAKRDVSSGVRDPWDRDNP